jgi:hypothetical protein
VTDTQSDILLLLGVLITTGIVGVAVGALWPRLQRHLRLIDIVMYGLAITVLILFLRRRYG